MIGSCKKEGLILLMIIFYLKTHWRDSRDSLQARYVAQHFSARCVPMGSSYSVLLKSRYLWVLIYKQKRFEETPPAEALFQVLWILAFLPFAVCKNCKIHFNTLNTLVIVAVWTVVVAVSVFFLKPIVSYFGLNDQQQKGCFFRDLVGLKGRVVQRGAWAQLAEWCLNARANCNSFISEHT